MESGSVTSVVAGRGRGRGRGRLVLPEQVENVPFSNVPSQNSELFGDGDVVSNPKTHHLVERNGVIRKQTINVPPAGSSIQTEDHDHENSFQILADTLITFSSSSSSSDQLSVSSILGPTDPEVSSCPSRGPLPAGHTECPISYFLPKYLKTAKPTKRLSELKSSPVKILKVLDDRESIYVAFQDKDSLDRFNCLVEEMGSFYSSPKGFAFQKPAKLLEKGEIVAACLSTSSEATAWRRVKVQRVQEGHTLKGVGFNACVIDIDDLSHWNVRTAFCLYESFYNHPVQACLIQIRNFTDMYPKGIFEALFQEKQRFIEVMRELSSKILMSMIGRNIKITNILESNDEDKEMLTAEIDLDVNWRLQPLYWEFFKTYFTPPVPKIGGVYLGTITDVVVDEIGVCLKDSLYEPIDRILNEIDLEKIKSTEDELLTAVNIRMCKQFIGFNDDKSRLCRISVKSFYGEHLKVIYMDTARETLMTVEKLICSMSDSDNPNIPSVLSLVPAQGIRFKLTGMKTMCPGKCEDLYGKSVYFKVSRSSNIRESLLEAEILDEPVQE